MLQIGRRILKSLLSTAILVSMCSASFDWKQRGFESFHSEVMFEISVTQLYACVCVVQRQFRRR